MEPKLKATAKPLPRWLAGVLFLGLFISIGAEKYGREVPNWAMFSLPLLATGLLVYSYWNTYAFNRVWRWLSSHRFLVGTASVMVIALAGCLIFFTYSSANEAGPEIADRSPSTENAIIAPDDKISILFAGIDGDEEGKFGLSNIVSDQLNEALRTDKRVSFVNLPAKLPHSFDATSILESNNADALIVGKYFVNEKNVRVRIDFFVRGYFSKQIGFDEQLFDPAVITATLVEIDSRDRVERFTFQEDISNRLERFAHFLLGSICLDSGQFQDALYYFDRAAETPGELPLDTILAAKSRALFSNGMKEESLSTVSEAIRINPSASSYWTERAAKNLDAGHLKKAIEDAGQAIRLSGGDSAAAWEIRGAAYYILENFNQARRDLEASIRVAPDNWTARARLTSVKEQLGDLDGAVKDLTTIIDSDAGPGLKLTARLNRSADLLELQRLNEAKTDIDYLVENAPHNEALVKALTNRGAYYEIREEVDSQIADYEQALHLIPDHTGILFKLSSVLRNQGRNNEALYAVNTAIATINNAPPNEKDIARRRDMLALLYHTRQEISFALGDFDKAISDLDILIGDNPNDFGLYLDYCTILYERSYFEFTEASGRESLKRASGACARALALTPDASAARYQLTGILIDLDEYATARQLLVEIARSGGDQVLTVLRVAELEYRIGNVNRAIQLIQKALTVAPGLNSENVLREVRVNLEYQAYFGLQYRSRRAPLRRSVLRDLIPSAYPLIYEIHHIDWNDVIGWRV